MRARGALVAVVLIAILALSFVWWGQDESEAPLSNAPSEHETEDETVPSLLGVGSEEREAAGESETPVTVTTTTTSGTRQPDAALPEERETPYRIAGPSGDVETGTLHVQVVDGHGHPRGGVELELYTFDGTTAKKSHERDIDASGACEITGLAPGRVSVWTTAGDAKRMAGVTIEAGRVTELVVPMAFGARIEGTVRHVEKGPLEGIRVSMKSRGDPWLDSVFGVTDADGRYAFEGVLPGTYEVGLTGDAAGYHPRPRGHVVVSDDTAIERDFELGAVALQGVVKDDAGRAIPGASLTLQSPLYVTVQTNAQGEYVFRDVPPGPYTLVASKDGYGLVFSKPEVVADATNTFDVTLQPAAVLDMAIRVEDGGPLPPEVILSLRPLGEGGGTRVATNIQVGADGTATYAQIVPGHYAVSVSAKRFEPADQEVHVTPGTNAASFTLVRNTPLEAVSIQGTIRDAATNQPLADVEIAVNQRRAASTDDAGAYAVRGLAPSTYTLIVSKDGYGIRYIRGVEVAEGPTTFDIELTPAAVMRLRLVNARGEPVSGNVILGISPKEGTKGTRIGTGITADSSGNATYRQIVPGTYSIRVSQEGAGRGSVETEILAGENTLDIQLR